MLKKWKKAGVAILIAALTVTGAGYAFANEKADEPIDLSQLTKEPTIVEESPKTVEIVEEEPVVNKDETIEEELNEENEVTEEDDAEGEEIDLPEIPDGYKAGNLAALGKAYENAGNATAKAAIKRNMERSIAKWESKQPQVDVPEQPEIETPEQPKVEKEKPVQQEQPTTKPVKAVQVELNAKHKEERAALRATQKEEREALKAERKAEKEHDKQQKKEKKNK